jgi:hypothetical protein
VQQRLRDVSDDNADQHRVMELLAGVNSIDLQPLYAQLNTQYFEDCLPPCQIAWSRRLTRTAGNIDVRRQLIHLSVPLLIDAFRSDSLFGREYLVCGVLCDAPEVAVREILKHEMIHLWLHVRGLPSGHTMEFRIKAREIGQPKTRHDIELPAPRSGWIYTCPVCNHATPRRRRYSRAVACLRCCKRFNGGQYHERFKLRGRRIANPPTS